MDPPPHSPAADRRPPDWWLLVGMLAVLLPWRLWRASLGESLWVDEFYTILVTRRPMEALVAITGVDAHPPLYYILLKGWLLVTEWLGIERSALLLRLPSVVAWAAMVIAGWFLGRAVMGRGAGTLLAVLLALNGHLGAVAKDARNYPFVCGALLVCFLLVVWIDRRALAGTITRRAAAGWWVVYTLAASMALWMHLLSAFVLFLLGLLWIGRSVARRRMDVYTVGGFVAQSAVVLGFVPWLLRLHEQLNYLQTTDLSWMTPADLHNWWRALTIWSFAGRIPEWLMEAMPWTEWVASASLLPVVAWFVAVAVAARRVGRSSIPLPPGSLEGLMLALWFVSILWWLAFNDIIEVFHGSRYPILVAPMLCAAVAGMAVGLARRWGRGGGLAVLLLVPALATSVVGDLRMAWQERYRGIDHMMIRAAHVMPPHGGRLYVSPNALALYFAEALRPWEVRPVAELLAMETPPSVVHLMTYRDWQVLYPAVDRVFGNFMETLQVADIQRVSGIPKSSGWDSFLIYRLEGPNDNFRRMQRMMNERIDARHRPQFAHAASVALPEDQFFTDGFPYLEVLAEGEPFSWGELPTARLRFSDRLEAGDYTLELYIHRHPYPEAEQEMTFQFVGESTVFRAVVPGGTQHLRLPVRLERSHQDPTLLVSHPTWRPCDHIPGAADRRTLTFLLRHALMEPAP